MPGNDQPWQKLRSDDFSDIDFTAVSSQLQEIIQGLLRADHTCRLSAWQALTSPILTELQSRYDTSSLNPALVEEDASFLSGLIGSVPTNAMDVDSRA